MSSKPFSIREVFGTSWRVTRAHFRFLLACFCFYSSVPMVFMLLEIGCLRVAAHFLRHAHTDKQVFMILGPFMVAGLAACSMIYFAIYLGWIRAVLRIVRGEPRRWSDLVGGGRYFWRGLGTLILMGLSIVGGFLLLIVPGIICTLKFSQALFVAADENARPLAAMRRSAALTKGAKKDLLTLFFLVCFCNLLGLCAALIGIVFTLPFSIVVLAVAYERLRLGSPGKTVVFEKV